MKHAHVTLALTLVIAGCTAPPPSRQFDQGGGNMPVLNSASVTENRTPVDDALVCYGEELSRSRGQRAPLGVAVGDVRDFTGRMTEGEGAPITQGAGLMIYSALANLGSAVRVHERLDPRIAELELAYINERQLGDGRYHRASPDAAPAPWLPYMGGSILQSDYYIVGGITELNYAIATGGTEVTIGGVGALGRYVVINVAADLRIVNSRNLVVEHAVSMQKQLIGRETGADVFRFFGTRLFDIKGGERMTEPVQMAVRSVLQLATLDLLEAVSGVRNETCVQQVQPDTGRGQPRPSGTTSSGQWPPDARTAVSADAMRATLAAQQADRQTAQAPAPQSTPAVATAAAPAPEPTPAPAVRANTGAIVIGAATNGEAATGLWRRLRVGNPALFAAVQADIVSVNSEGGPYLVVVQHPRSEAAAFCSEVQAAGVDCAVAPPEVMAARAAATAATAALSNPPASSQSPPEAAAPPVSGSLSPATLEEPAQATSGTVMVDVFEDEDNARRTVEQLTAIGLTPRLRQEQTGSGQRWVVSVITARAPAMLARIRGLGFPDAYYLAE